MRKGRGEGRLMTYRKYYKGLYNSKHFGTLNQKIRDVHCDFKFLYGKQPRKINVHIPPNTIGVNKLMSLVNEQIDYVNFLEFF